MKNTRFNQPPRALRRPGVRCDNLVLLPGNLLAYKAQWQKIANALPQGAVLIVLPDADRPLAQTLKTVAAYCEAAGHPVTTRSEHLFR